MTGPDAPRSPQRDPHAPTRRDWLTCGGCLFVVAALIGGAVWLFTSLGPDDDSASSSSSSSSPSSGEAAGSSSSPPATGAPGAADPYSESPSPSASPPDPYDSGTCLDGTLPDSTTAQEVSDVDRVSCSAPDAHYKVIQTFPFTSELSSCEANPRTEYAFSSRYTINGATINEYVYCLVGLGSYARG
jgi:hypothetical protein